MNHFHVRMTFVLVGLLFLAGCGPDESSITQTVASQVAADVVATVAAQPTATPYPTQTPVDTAPPYPTYTPLATAVPADTATPYPTYTPYPTDTPEPEPTATTVVAANTPLPAVTSAAAPPAATVLPAVDQQAQLLGAVESALHDIDVAKSSLWSVSFTGFPGSGTQNPTDCPTLVAANDRLANGLILNTTAANATVQHAYTLYRTAVDSALTALQLRTDECRGFIAAGMPGTVMNQADYNVIEDKLEQSQNWLNQALAELRQE